VSLSSKRPLEQNKPSHFVNIVVNNKRTNALCDTGCSVSCISEDYFHNLRIPKSALKLAQSSHLVTANQSPMIQLGCIDLTLNFNGMHIISTFAVLRGLSFNIICGIDFMTENRLCPAHIIIV